MRRILTISVILFSLGAGGQLFAQEDFKAGDCPITVVRVHSLERGVIADVARWTEPWEIKAERNYFIVGVNAEGLRRLEALNVPVEVDKQLTADACAPHFRLPNQVYGLPGYPCYRTVEETFATASQLAIDYPTLAEFIDVGDSWEKTEFGGNSGYDMMVLKLTNSQFSGTPTGHGQGKPVLFVTSAIHAREYTTAELMIRFAEYLLDNYGVDADATWLLDEHEIHLMLHTNPDGRKHAEAGDYWRKNTNENYCGTTSSYRGADLNRNFEFHWACCNGSSGSQCDETFRGSAAASEPEAEAVQSYARSVFLDQRGPNDTDAAPDTATGIYLDIHSYSQLVLWPWGYTNTVAPNGIQMQTLGRKFAYFNGYEPDQAIGLYPTDGTTDDFVYGDLGVAAYTFELGTAFFQDCSTFEATILPDNFQALIYAAKVVRSPYLTPSGPDILNLGFSNGAFIAPGALIDVSADANDTLFNNSNGTQPTGTVSAARCSLDAAPWSIPTPTFNPLSAVDGAFDGGVESVEGTLDTTGLADGRHTLFCQAQDDDAQWGPVSALFFYIMDPASAPHIAGTVTSAADGSAIEATIDVGSLSSGTSDPTSGTYDLIIPEGNYTVVATPIEVNHSSMSISNVIATTGATTTVNFQLQPFEVSLSDDAENGVEGWTAQAPWALTTESAHSTSHSWTDSPGGDYGNSADSSLTSTILNLSNVQDVELRFFHSYDTESTYDYAILEWSRDGGSTWSEAARWDGPNPRWEEVILPLSALDGAPQARIRFRLDTDGSVTRDGWHVDDITLRGTLIEPPMFTDGFESGETGGWDVTTP